MNTNLHTHTYLCNHAVGSPSEYVEKAIAAGIKTLGFSDYAPYYYKYENGKRVKHTVKPVLGEKAAHNGKVVYSLDFNVTPHQLRHTYITNLIYASIDPKTVQYLAGHKNSKITMDIYAKVKYNKPNKIAGILNDTFELWDNNYEQTAVNA